MNTVKPTASNWIRFIVAVLGLLAGGFVIAAIFIPSSLQNIFGATIVSKLGGSFSTLSTFQTIASILSMLLFPLFGLLGDRIGRRGLILGGGLLVAVAMLVAGFAGTPFLWGVTILLRAIGMAMVLPCLLASLLEAPTSRWFLAYAAAVYFSNVISAEVNATLYVSLLVNRFDTNAIFFFAAALTFIFLLLAAGLTLGIVAIRRHFLWDPAWLESPRHPRHRLLVTCLLLIVLFGSSTFTVVSQLAWPYISNSQIFPLMTIFSVTYLVALVFSGIFADLFNWLLRAKGVPFARALFILLGLFVNAIGMFLLLVNPWQGNRPAALLFPAAILSGLGVGMLIPALIASLAGLFNHRRWGLVLGGYLGIGVLASLLSSGIFGLVRQVLFKSADVFVRVIPLLTLISFIISLALAVVVILIQSKPMPQPVEPTAADLETGATISE